ncbi:ATP-grasp domain-containing protein [uncultured Methanomethylovorans sp.]|uniref:carboxylate--amine ligase n=1 Tax=uncultured Methanomethylovorans sp. TaxID=183759 RepID=UPI002AA623EF|nr:ATP-grasp domain-containing protein [uncultured Methanomethylovorans sp.]
MPNVFVTDAQMRSSLAVIQSLGKNGLNVTAGEETRFTTGFFSKFTDQRVVYPSPKKNPDEFIDFLTNELQQKEYDVLFPIADACLKPLVCNEKEISKYTSLALPPKDVFFRGYDKGNTLKFAIDNDIPCPKTYFVNDKDELYNLTNEFEYPLVIKPRISSGSRGFHVCHSFEELVTKFQDSNQKYGNLLIQEYIPSGGEFGVYTLFNFDSEPRALTVQRRIRSYPASGGPSTLRETVKNETTDKAVEMAFKLLKAMGWIGVAMVEFRIDARDGIPKLMEVNSRFWGSLKLSILGGVDFPYLLYRMHVDGDVTPVFDYKAGVKCRWLLPGDILWFLTTPNKYQNSREFFKIDTPFDIISREDPGPTFGFMFASMRYMFDRDMWKFILRR